MLVTVVDYRSFPLITLIVQGERILIGNCGKFQMLTEDGTEDLPISPGGSRLLSSCSNITYHKYEDGDSRGYIEASDCVNGTWVRGLGEEEYSGLVRKYEQQRRNKNNMVKRRSADEISLIPWEEDITILPYVSITA